MDKKDNNIGLLSNKEKIVSTQKAEPYIFHDNEMKEL